MGGDGNSHSEGGNPDTETQTLHALPQMQMLASFVWSSTQKAGKHQGIMRDVAM